MLYPTSKYYEREESPRHYYYEEQSKKKIHSILYKYEESGKYPTCVVSLDHNFNIINKECWRTGDAECRKYIHKIATDTGTHCGQIHQLFIKCNRRSFLRACEKEREYNFQLGTLLQPHLNFGRYILCDGQRNLSAIKLGIKNHVTCCCGIKFENDDQLRFLLREQPFLRKSRCASVRNALSPALQTKRTRNSTLVTTSLIDAANKASPEAQGAANSLLKLQRIVTKSIRDMLSS